MDFAINPDDLKRTQAVLATNGFGEVLHTAAWLVAMCYVGKASDVELIIDSLEPPGDIVSDAQMLHFLHKFHPINSKLKRQNKDDPLTTNRTTLTAYSHLDELGPPLIREEIRKAFVFACSPVNPSIEGQLHRLLGNIQRNKVLVWVRRGSKDRRGTSEASLQQVVEALDARGLVAVLVGDLRDIKKVPAKAIDLTPVQNTLYTLKASYVSQGGMLLCAHGMGVFASIGMMSGGMDFGAFLGIPTVNITKYAPSPTVSQRMRAMAKIAYMKNVGYDEACYDSQSNTPLPQRVIDEAMSYISAWHKKSTYLASWWDPVNNSLFR
ncbi:hypothetical protein ONV78_15005 [Hahella sp. CR1]|uniref:hypothetical protein n=1 Tax=Hahella sp. CR1 TaxID=2992807 RepID=UPI0024415D3A|nr:hypothetical protein [Hahella sp. CR1]MDG9669051.1 hypothetical protein [Hahella sp. CR1]